MKVCGLLAPRSPAHRWFELLDGERDDARELHDLLVALAAIRQTGAEVCFVAEAATGLELLDSVARQEPDLVLLASSSARWPGATTLTPRLRRVSNTPIVLYGSHPRRFPEHALATAAGADLAVAGGVDALVEAVNRVHLGRAGRTAGVWDRSGPAAPRPLHPGTLPTALWSLVGARRLAGSAALRMGSRGGPYGGPAASPAAVARSLLRAARLRPRGGIHALDRGLGSDFAWLDGLCARRERSPTWPAWSCTLGVEEATPPAALRLAAAGCTQVELELGAPGARPTDGFPAHLAAAARALRGAGLEARCTLTLGAPGSSARSDRAAWKLAAQVDGPGAVNPRLHRPEPGDPEWVDERWHPGRWVEAQLGPARAVTWPRGYRSLGEVEGEWKRAWLRSAVASPWRGVWAS